MTNLEVTDSSLQRFVPRAAVEWPDHDAVRWRVQDGTLCFVDISGFTNLSERLARRGRIGAEELTAVLNRVFGSMLDLAYARGGRLLKFGGDALLVLFGDDDHAIQGASAAVEMRAALRESARIPTSVGRVPLKMSVGLHSGEIHLFRAGSSHQELVVAGPAPTITTAMETAADPGEIVISAALRRRLPRGSADRRKAAGYVLSWRRGRAEPVGISPRVPVSAEALAHCVPVGLRDRLSRGVDESEHRYATIGFVKFNGTDALMAEGGPAAVAEALDELMATVQDAADREGVTFLASDIDADGGKVILATGIPVTREDDEGRLLRAARTITDADLRLSRRIGVNRGHVFAGAIGTPFRATYTVMGDTVNLAARLMAAATDGEVFSNPEVLARSRTVFATIALEPFMVKGKSEPVRAHALGAEQGGRGERRHGLPFMGRELERRSLTETIESGLTGSGAVALIRAEAGMGKTRLVEEVLHEIGGMSVFLVRAEPYGMAAPYRAARDAARQMLGVERADQPTMARRLLGTVEELAPHLTDLAPLLGDVAHVEVATTPAVEAIAPEFRRERLADVVVELLAQTMPDRLVILVEDAQWMDEASSVLLDRLATATASRSWAMIVTRRPMDGGYSPPEAWDLTLEPLAEPDIRVAVIDATAGNPLRPDQVDDIVGRAAGSPLFLEELLKVIEEAGEITDLPDSLDAVISAQLDALAPSAHLVVRHASVLGRSFRRIAIERLLAAESFEVDDATRTALDGYFDGEGDRLRFRNPLTRDVAYEGLSYQRRRRLHRRAGEIMEDLAGGDLESIADVLALHYSMAGDRQRTWAHALIAGDRARHAHANVEAVTQYERALDAARGRTDIEDRERADVWVRLGDVRQLSGMLDASLEAYRRASMLVGDDTLARAEVTLKRARARERVGAFSSALRELRRAERLLATDPDQARTQPVMARLAAFRAMIRWGQEHPRRARARAEEAAMLARASGESDALAQSLMVLDLADLALGGPGRGTNLREALELFRALGDLPHEAQARGNLGFIAAHAGRWDEAVGWFTSCRDAYERVGDIVGAALAGLNLGEMLTNQRRYDESEPILRNSRRVMQAAGFTDGAAYASVQLARVLIEADQLDDARTALTEAESTFMTMGQASSALEAAVVMADCLGRVGDAAGALEYLGIATARTDPEDADHFACSVALARARALISLGRLDEARAHLETGTALARDRNMPYEEALLRLEMSNIVEHDGRTDPARAETEGMLESLGVRLSGSSSSHR